MSTENVVKVYSTSTCPHCMKVKSFLRNNGVEYQDCDVMEDQNARDEMRKISGQLGVPVILIGHDVVIGFDEAGLKNSLGIK